MPRPGFKAEPVGRYAAESWLDSDGRRLDVPLRVKVTVEVAVPSSLSAAERKAVEALAAAATENPRDHLIPRPPPPDESS